MRIAVTGGIAEGKSTVMGYLRDLGETTASSDEIARSVFDRSDIQEQIARLTGTEMPVDRAHLRDMLSERPGLRRRLNELMHPAIWRGIADTGAVWIEIPLLVETCLQGHFNRVWVVTCGSDEQHRRLLARIGDEAQANRLISTQLSSEIKIPFGDEIIRTNRPESVVQGDVRQALRRELAR
jgi:dephospho-CoA kinase